MSELVTRVKTRFLYHACFLSRPPGSSAGCGLGHVSHECVFSDVLDRCLLVFDGFVMGVCQMFDRFCQFIMDLLSDV